jgi:hypothetical protein
MRGTPKGVFLYALGGRGCREEPKRKAPHAEWPQSEGLEHRERSNEMDEHELQDLAELAASLRTQGRLEEREEVLDELVWGLQHPESLA